MMWRRIGQRHCSDEVLLAHLDGELSRGVEKATRTHLQVCWNCRARLAKRMPADYALLTRERHWPYASMLSFPLREGSPHCERLDDAPWARADCPRSMSPSDAQRLHRMAGRERLRLFGRHIRRHGFVRPRRVGLIRGWLASLAAAPAEKPSPRSRVGCVLCHRPSSACRARGAILDL